MEWSDKVELAKLLNNACYAEAVDFVKGKDIDAQAMDIFITGFDLTKIGLLQPIKDVILSYDSQLLDWRSAVRLGAAKKFLKSL